MKSNKNYNIFLDLLHPLSVNILHHLYLYVFFKPSPKDMVTDFLFFFFEKRRGWAGKTKREILM